MEPKADAVGAGQDPIRRDGCIGNRLDIFGGSGGDNRFMFLDRMKAKLFGIDNQGGCYVGFDTGKRWNGWEVPVFSMTECAKIAAEVGEGVFEFVNGGWQQRFDDEEEAYRPAPVMIAGEPHWQMGDGYMWEVVALDHEYGNFYRDGKQVGVAKIPLTVAAKILKEVWAGSSTGNLTIDGVKWEWD